MRGFLYFGALAIVAWIAADAGYPGGIWAGVLFVIICAAILDVEHHLHTLTQKNADLERQLARHKPAPTQDREPPADQGSQSLAAFRREWRRVSGQK